MLEAGFLNSQMFAYVQFTVISNKSTFVDMFKKALTFLSGTLHCLYPPEFSVKYEESWCICLILKATITAIWNINYIDQFKSDRNSYDDLISEDNRKGWTS